MNCRCMGSCDKLMVGDVEAGLKYQRYLQMPPIGRKLNQPEIKLAATEQESSQIFQTI